MYCETFNILLVLIWFLESRPCTDLDSKLGGKSMRGGGQEPNQISPENAAIFRLLLQIVNISVKQCLFSFILLFDINTLPMMFAFLRICKLSIIVNILDRNTTLQSCRNSFWTGTDHWWTGQGNFWDGGTKAEHHLERVCRFMWQEFCQVALSWNLN